MINNKTLKTSSVLLLMIILMSSSISFSSSYAQEDFEGAQWKFVYIVNDDCHTNDIIRTDALVGLTSKYFELYQFENVQVASNCITISEYSSNTDENVDLLILVFDEETGMQYLQESYLDGMYIHLGKDRLTNHTIIACDCFDGKVRQESALAPWVLSHELSHFVLSYKGYSKANVEKLIHEKEAYFIENCIASIYVENFCADSKTTIRSDSGTRDFVVMTPYQPAIGNTLVKYVSDGIIDSDVIELQRDLTKMWLTGMIDDIAYVETVKRLVDPPQPDDSELEAQFTVPNGFVIPEVSRAQEVDWEDLLNSKEGIKDENMDYLLNLIPFEPQEFSESEESKIPFWFRERALMWSEEKIANKVFLDGVEHLVRMGAITLN